MKKKKEIIYEPQKKISAFKLYEEGFNAFEKYFLASKWLHYDTTIMEITTSNDLNIECPSISKDLLKKWFPIKEGK